MVGLNFFDTFLCIKNKHNIIEEISNMAEPIRLGLVLEGEDAREFEERMKNPKVSKEQVAFLREAIRVYETHPF